MHAILRVRLKQAVNIFYLQMIVAKILHGGDRTDESAGFY